MSAAPTPAPQPLRALIWGWLACGVLDITAAIVVSKIVADIAPQRILHSVAAGLLGTSAYQGGNATAALGLGLHFVVAFGATATYVALARKISFLHRHAVWSGLAYGLLVYWFMNGVVLPLSALHAPVPSPFTVRMVRGMVIHLLCVGLPIALAAKFWMTPRRA